MRALLLIALAACGGESTRDTSQDVKVVAAPNDVWCTERGNCYADGGDCNRADRGVCTRTESYACMTFTTRADGAQMLECWASYGECVTRQRTVERDPELKSLDIPCVIFRKGG